MEMIILVGISGSGKTTWCTKHLPHHSRISLDDIKNHNRNTEDGMIAFELEKENNVVIDDTNLTRDIRQRNITIARRYGAHVNAIFFCINIQKAQAQNRKRKKRIPPYVLGIQKKWFEMPHKNEGLEFVQVLNV